MRKADCTPEQWDRYRARMKEYYQKNREKELARRREYNSRPEVKAARQAYDNTPEKKAQRKAYADQWNNANKKRVWAEIKADPEKLAAHYAKMRTWRTGMSPEQFDALMVVQEGKCAICGLVFSGSKGDRTTKQKSYPCADHCHDGGGPRGLLCTACNHIEGRIRKSGLSVLEFCDRLHGYLLDPPIKQL